MEKTTPRSSAFLGYKVAQQTILKHPPWRQLKPFRPYAPWRCRFCHLDGIVVFDDRDTLVLHEGQHFDFWDRMLVEITGHPEVKGCPYCLWIGQDEDLAYHVRLHRSFEASHLVWECPYCEWKTERGKRGLSHHITSKHSGPDKPLLCPDCRLSYPPQPDGLNPHKPPNGEDRCPEHFRCPFCNWFSATHPEDRIQHIRQLHPDVLQDNPHFRFDMLDWMLIGYPGQKIF